MSQAAQSLGPGGRFEASLDGFHPRKSQQQLARAIESALEHQSILVTESGTGTGKTFAYLVPALLSGKRIIISTGTKHLQEQLYNIDLPRVREILEVPVTTSLLKGRSNYLCLHRLKQAAAPGAQTGNEELTSLASIERWSMKTRDGDIAGHAGLSEDSPLWRLVTSNSENCLGSRCSDYEQCYVQQARKRALESEIVVVNHHLFFADLSLKEEGFGQLLPGAEAVIFDEAHQLPEIASLFFGTSLSRQQLLALCRDTVKEELSEKSGVRGLKQATGILEKAVADFHLALRPRQGRGSWASLQDKKLFEAHSQMGEALSNLGDLLNQAGGKGEGLASCASRAGDLLERYYRFVDDTAVENIAWYENSDRNFTLYLTPLEVASTFSQTLEQDQRSWIFTSATLTIKGQFSHFTRQLGVEHADTGHWDSPFDYESISLCYLPRALPDPRHPDYTDRVIDAAVPVIKASGGRTFFLFTSFRALNRAADRLGALIEYPILVQGEAPRSELLQRFRSLGNAVLLGTSSFWEGVDVQGEALSCVIIDKLPFSAPDDPVLRARGEAMERRGQNPFMEYQLPQAVIALKQGVGRLIRSEQDRGVLMLCDPRLKSKPYGRVFLDSIPPIPRTDRLEDVESFFSDNAVETEEVEEN
ncbi:MAG: ATP-dependent DNA helicase [Acidiferrobacterales bacterium]